MPVSIPCGQCIGCRLERSRQWAVRCVHEASLHERNCFITLTYDPDHLPENGTLVMEHFQLFMKRLRKEFGAGIRFFHCGEYGEKQGRPHYHAALFNFDFPDKVFLRRTPRGDVCWSSASLQRLWGKGRTELGSLTFESAAYIARYITKKQLGKGAQAHYEGRKPEYTTMSRKPGIGKGWLEKWTADVYPVDRVVLKRGGRMIEMRPPRFYDVSFELDDPETFATVKRNRKRAAEEFGHSGECAGSRLLVRREVQERKLLLLKRGYENGA
jgi:hypothetical protein